MQFSGEYQGRAQEIAAVFRESFTASEGAAEGELIANLVTVLLASAREDQSFVCTALDDTGLIGAIVLSKMQYVQDARLVYLLSPVAVISTKQGQGVGQNLIRYGFEVIASAGADFVITYGDPDFYGKVGFEQIGEDFAAAPYRLQQPEGWLGRALGEKPKSPLQGKAAVVPAFRNPELW